MLGRTALLLANRRVRVPHDQRKESEIMDQRIKAAIEIMLRDTQRQFHTRELARHVNLSPRRFSQLFKAETCLSPSQCVRYWRLREAKWLLEHSLLKVNDVAAHVGFRHLSSFTREFKKLYRYPPSVFRGRGQTNFGILPRRSPERTSHGRTLQQSGRGAGQQLF